MTFTEIVQDAEIRYDSSEWTSRAAWRRWLQESVRTDDMYEATGAWAHACISSYTIPQDHGSLPDPFAPVPVIGSYTLEDINAYINKQDPIAMSYENRVIAMASAQVTHYSQNHAAPILSATSQAQAPSTSNTTTWSQLARKANPFTKWKRTTTPPTAFERPAVEPFSDDEDEIPRNTDLSRNEDILINNDELESQSSEDSLFQGHGAEEQEQERVNSEDYAFVNANPHLYGPQFHMPGYDLDQLNNYLTTGQPMTHVERMTAQAVVDDTVSRDLVLHTNASSVLDPDRTDTFPVMPGFNQRFYGFYVRKLQRALEEVEPLNNSK